MTSRLVWLWPILGGLFVIICTTVFYVVSDLGSSHFAHYPTSMVLHSNSENHDSTEDSEETSDQNLLKTIREYFIPLPEHLHKEEQKLVFDESEVTLDLQTPKHKSTKQLTFQEPLAARLASQDFMARLTWLASTLALAMIIVISGILAFHTIASNSGDEKHPGSRKLLIWLGSITVLILVAFALPAKPLGIHASRDIITFVWWVVGPGIPRIGNTLLGAGAALSMLVMVAGSKTVVPPRRALETPDLIHMKSRRLQLLLYVVALCLVAMVFNLFALHSWPAAYTLDDTTKEVINNMAAGIAGAAGIFCSLLLAGVYLPAAAILRLRLNKLSKNPSPRSGSSKKPNPKQDLYSQPTRTVYQLLAILAPMLMGLLGKFVSLV